MVSDRDPFVVRLNIERWRRQLEAEQNDEQRKVLRELIAEAEGTLKRMAKGSERP
jgi:hypothetical protein